MECWNAAIGEYCAGRVMRSHLLSFRLLRRCSGQASGEIFLPYTNVIEERFLTFVRNDTLGSRSDKGKLN